LGVSAIDEPDQRGIGDIVDDVKATIVLMNAEHLVEIQTKGRAKNNAVDSTVANKEEVLALLILKNLEKTVHNSFGKISYTFSIARGLVVQKIGLALLQFMGEVFTNLFEGESFPVPEIHFPEFWQDVKGDIMMSGYDSSAFEGSSEVTAIDCAYVG
jgi:hypothetical protein